MMISFWEGEEGDSYKKDGGHTTLPLEDQFSIKTPFVDPFIQENAPFVGPILMKHLATLYAIIWEIYIFHGTIY